MSNTDPRRADFERRQRRRSLTIATTSTIIVLVALIVLIPRMPRWDRVRASFFDFDQFQSSFPRLLEAFVLDVKIFLWSVPLIFTVALTVALLRNSRSPALFPLRMFTIAFVDVMRGVPVLLWIYLIGFGVPGLGLERPWNSPLLWGTVALVLTYSAYVSEVLRAGIEGVH
ncbi:MAG: ABC transporter permease subunit, partial [Actinomycetota bacterium]